MTVELTSAGKQECYRSTPRPRQALPPRKKKTPHEGGVKGALRHGDSTPSDYVGKGENFVKRAD
jgi:hypothetical protein